MVLSDLTQERWMTPSPKSPKRLKLRFRDFTVSPHGSQKHDAKGSAGEGRRSLATKIDDGTASVSSKRRRTPTPRIEENYDYKESMRKKLVFDSNAAADRMRNARLGKNKVKEEARESPLRDGAVKLSERRSVSPETQRRKERESPLRDGCSEKKRPDGAVKLSKQRRVSRERARTKLSVQLSREEINEDFMKIANRRLPRKPNNKRPSDEQKRLDALFPGSLLTEVTADLYKVQESPEVNKRNKWKAKDM